jgi:hypothetical protein
LPQKLQAAHQEGKKEQGKPPVRSAEQVAMTHLILPESHSHFLANSLGLPIGGRNHLLLENPYFVRQFRTHKLEKEDSFSGGSCRMLVA